MTTARSLPLALGACLLLASPGCLSASSSGKVAWLRYTIELRSTSGARLGDAPIVVDVSYPYGSSEREVHTDPDGRIEGTERRTRDASNPFVRKAPISNWESFEFRLPEVHPTGVYSVDFVLDPEHPRWTEIERERQLEPPLRIEPGSDPRGGTYLYRDGAIYFTANGFYDAATVLADGEDVRRVPLQAPPENDSVPGEPRLEVRARAAPLTGERGWELHIWLTIPDPPDRIARRSGVLRSLRERLDRIAAGRAQDDAEFRRPEAAWLAGSTREEIVDALGEPDLCVPDRGRDMRRATSPSVPCRGSEGDFVYLFYRLPTGSRGGGPVLRLEFAADGTCTSSTWEFTQ